MDGNEAVWRKFVNAVALDVFRIDRAVVGGELGVDGGAGRPVAGAGRRAPLRTPCAPTPAATLTEAASAPRRTATCFQGFLTLRRLRGGRAPVAFDTLALGRIWLRDACPHPPRDVFAALSIAFTYLQSIWASSRI
jgi:hypothetical protein